MAEEQYIYIALHTITMLLYSSWKTKSNRKCFLYSSWKTKNAICAV